MRTPEICETCGGTKEMYYGPWCSKCDVPQIEIVESLNLKKCMRHVERKYLGIEDENDRRLRNSAGYGQIWEGLCEWGGISNDTTMFLPILEASKGDGSIGELSEEAIEYLQAMVVAFDLENHPNIMWECSW